MHGLQLVYCTCICDDSSPGHFQLIVPASLQNQSLRHYHDIPTGGHLGAEIYLDKIKNAWHLPKIKGDIEKYCLQSDLCAEKKPSRKSRAYIQQYVLGKPMERVSMDVLGPLPLTTNGNRKKVHISSKRLFQQEDRSFPITRSSVKNNSQHFSQRIYGTLLHIHSDQGHSFEAN